MYVTALRAAGYRNLNTTIGLCGPLAVIVGENNAGKSNVIDALRAVLEPEAGPRHRNWIREEDFAHDGKGERVADQLELEVRLEGLTDEEQARLVTCLAPNEGPGIAKIRLKATIGPNGRVATEWYGGDSDHPDVERHAREAIRFAYLHPLRDAAGDLRPGRDNKLVGLLSSLAPEDDPDRAKIEDVARAANDALDDIETIKRARKFVDDRLTGMTGSGRFKQESELEFEDPAFRQVVASLRAKIGELAALEMSENGLGYNNLLYMAVLLAALSEVTDEEPTLRVLLVEEPEAHLHPQLQDLLMRFLESEAGDGTQVVVTTHSPSFASSARVDRLTVMSRPEPGTGPVARLPREFELEERQLEYLRRFLDVTKASLFFARGVILVEGVAEQLLVPVIAERLGRSLSTNGVAVINIGGVAFPPFTDLFGEDRLPYRLAVISDGDAKPDDDELDGEDAALSPRAKKLAERTSDNVLVKLAERTLEWDLANAGNQKLMFEALKQVKPKAGPKLETDMAGKSSDEVATAILGNVKEVKGRYAQELAELFADPETTLKVPTYLRDAIAWVAEETGTDSTDPPDP